MVINVDCQKLSPLLLAAVKYMFPKYGCAPWFFRKWLVSQSHGDVKFFHMISGFIFFHD